MQIRVSALQFWSFWRKVSKTLREPSRDKKKNKKNNNNKTTREFSNQNESYFHLRRLLHGIEKNQEQLSVVLLSGCAKKQRCWFVKACREWENPWLCFAIPVTFISVPWDCSIAADIPYWHCDLCYSVDRKRHLLHLSSVGVQASPACLYKPQREHCRDQNVRKICFPYMFAAFSPSTIDLTWPMCNECFHRWAQM